MTVLIGNSAAAATAAYFAGNQVVPVQIDYQLEVSQRLVDAALNRDLKTACECITDPFVDVNFVGAVSLRSKRTEIMLCDEHAHEVRSEYEEFRTEVTALFLAAHAGNSSLVRKLLSAGANVNQKLFKGYATTAAVREGHVEILEVLLSAGVCQQACEEALLEASYVGQPRSSELLMRSQIIRSHVAVRALVLASCRGFVDVVRALIGSGVDANATSRVLLQSSKPSLHINADCSALVAAIVSRQVSVVRLLLQAGVKTEVKARIGAWSWDVNTGEEFRVGAGLAEPYSVTWCAVEYYEASGAILRMLLQRLSPDTLHYGRTVIHHAILCRNRRALDVLLISGGDVECSIAAVSKIERPIHLAARLGLPDVLQCLITAGCDLSSRTECGETALSICERYRHDECLKILAPKFSSLRFVNQEDDIEAPETPVKCSESNHKSEVFEQVDINDHDDAGYDQDDEDEDDDHDVVVVVVDDDDDDDDDSAALNALHRAAKEGETDRVHALISGGNSDINVPDADGYTPLMLAAKEGHGRTCKLLISHGARCDFENARHETALTLARRTAPRFGHGAEEVILDEIARKHVLEGGQVKKHTKHGKGSPHAKMLRMVEDVGVLRWGKSKKRNVVCRQAEVGPSATFRWNRRRKSDCDEPGIFHVVTTGNKEVHFVCAGGNEIARLWVRGIKLVTKEAIFGGNK